MEDLKNTALWIENVGEIMVSEHGEFHWMVPEIFISTYRSCVASPYFTFDLEDWRLVILPSDGYQSSLDSSYFGLFLWIRGGSNLKRNYNVEFSVKERNGKELWTESGALDSYYGIGFWDFLLTDRDKLDKCSLSGRIKISCIIKRQDSTDLLLCPVGEEEGNKNANAERSDEKQKDGPKCKGVDLLVQNFENLLHHESGSDVVLKTNDHDFKAHRLILSARSPVFCSMFQHDMEEKKTGEVDISDCSTAAFKVFLQYLYSGKTDEMTPTNVLDLYYIADKYQVADLKSSCVKHMISNLAIYNFCDIIALSLRHGESDLQKFATRFFCRNVKEIVKTVQWQKYITENPIQANELFIKAINA